jgi:hypothetical protein
VAQSRYSAIPKSSHAPVEVALVAATRKTVLQVATPSTQDITIIQAALSFDGISATDAPVIWDLIETDVAATVTSLTPEKYSDPNAPASLCVGGTSATGYNASAEGTIGGSRLLAAGEVHPQSGDRLQLPLGREPGIAVSKFCRLRVLAGAGVNCIPELIWEE